MDIHSLVVKYKDTEREIGRKPNREEFLKHSGVSDWALRKVSFTEVIKASGGKPVHNNFNQESTPIFPEIIRPPRILYFDIESVGMEVKTYSLKTDYISPKNILKDWAMLSYAGVYESDPDKVFYLDQRFSEDKRDDEQVTIGLHGLLSNCDWVVGHNIDNFDLKKFNTKAAKYGLDPLHEIRTWDTLKIARRNFAISSNSLWFCAQFFGLNNQKSEHGKFPGDKLWDECMKGNIEAWDENHAYNVQDVKTTRDLFKYLAKYDKRIDLSSFYQTPTCSCGNHSFFKDGHSYKKNGVFSVYRCHDCGKAYLGKENLIDKDIRKGFFK